MFSRKKLQEWVLFILIVLLKNCFLRRLSNSSLFLVLSYCKWQIWLDSGIRCCFCILVVFLWDMLVQEATSNMVLFFWHSFSCNQAVALFKSYFGGAFDEDAIRNNFVLIYELLDGMLFEINIFLCLFSCEFIMGFCLTKCIMNCSSRNTRHESQITHFCLSNES